MVNPSKKFNKKVIAYFEKFIDNENFEVFVLKDKEYFNIHIISEKFQKDEMNTLKLQEPIESVNAEYFTDAKLISYLMEHFIWDRFYSELQEKSFLCSVDVHKE